MSQKIVYVTGCLGFIGYHVAKACLKEGWYVYGIDKCTYAANLNLLDDLQQSNKFKFKKEDINDLSMLYECDYVINTAAESHVDNSIVSSDEFIHTNINGVHHLLKLIRHMSNKPVFFHFSTDEVYGDINEGSHTETDLLCPSNPYSASKAAADMLTLAWARTYSIPYILVRPSNNYGIGQYVEKLIPRTIKYISLGKKIELHDQGNPKRTWLHVEDTADAIIAIIKSGSVNEIFNIAGNYEDKNINVVKKIISLLENTYDIEKYIKFTTRPGQDIRYSVNDTKLKSIGWTAKRNFDDELEEIVNYYRDNFIW